MSTRTGDNTTRRWVPIDQLLSAIEDDRIITLRPRPRPVFPASDEECYALNPPADCSHAKQEAGLQRAGYRTPRQIRMDQAEQRARTQYAARTNRLDA
jgi:hypothetical protein